MLGGLEKKVWEVRFRAQNFETKVSMIVHGTRTLFESEGIINTPLSQTRLNHI